MHAVAPVVDAVVPAAVRVRRRYSRVREQRNPVLSMDGLEGERRKRVDWKASKGTRVPGHSKGPVEGLAHAWPTGQATHEPLPAML